MATALTQKRIGILGGRLGATPGCGWAPGAPVATPPLDVAAAGARSGDRSGAYRPPWAWPLTPTPRVVRPFIAPPSPYAAGHRGLDLAGHSGQQVLAVAAGVITHAGSLAGRGTVTIEHPGGIRSTYEPLAIDTGIWRGRAISTGQVIGTLGVGGSHCAPAVCLHLGALRQGTSGQWSYVEPLFLLLAGEIVLLPSP